MVAFRDPNGIRPLVLGKRDVGDGRTEYMVASESVALDTLGFEFLRDVAPGEAVYITEKASSIPVSADNPVSNPCLFEYVYFARPDSFIDKISSTAPASTWGLSWAKRLPASGKIWILTSLFRSGDLLRHRAGNRPHSRQTLSSGLREEPLRRPDVYHARSAAAS